MVGARIELGATREEAEADIVSPLSGLVMWGEVTQGSAALHPGLNFCRRFAAGGVRYR